MVSADGARPKCSIVAKTYCVLMALTRQDFDTACPRLKGGATLRDLSEQHTSITSVAELLRRACHGNGKQPANESSVVGPSGTGLRRVFTNPLPIDRISFGSIVKSAINAKAPAAAPAAEAPGPAPAPAPASEEEGRA
jgi:hypothetical protein